MAIAALIVTAIAALVHVYVFVLESLLWRGPRAASIFGLDEPTARTTAPMAFNQGFYNLFLSVEVAIGIIAYTNGHHAVGATLILVGTLSMVGAGVVLVSYDHSKGRAALAQIVPALIGSLLLIATLARH